MAKAKNIRGLSGDPSFAEAAARVIDVRSKEMFGFADGVLDTKDPDRVHDMRVASRRLRAALEVFAPCFPKREHKAVLREVKALADALGERRDPDVQVQALETLRAALGQAEATGVNGLVAERRTRQTHGNETLEAALERLREQQLEERLAELVKRAPSK